MVLGPMGDQTKTKKKVKISMSSADLKQAKTIHVKANICDESGKIIAEKTVELELSTPGITGSQAIVDFRITPE